MKTTIDIPEELLRQAKSIAAMRGLKLKDLVTSLIEQELNSVTAQAGNSVVASSKVDVKLGHPQHSPKLLPTTKQPVQALNNAQIDAILLEQDLEKLGVH